MRTFINAVGWTLAVIWGALCALTGIVYFIGMFWEAIRWK